MNTSNTETSKSKVLVNIYSPLKELMDFKFNAAYLKRDAYLDIVFRIECKYLREEIKTPNSNRIKSYISKNLRTLDTKPVNFYLSQETIQLINDVCAEKNVPRDAFFNRVILLLTASTDLIRVLFPRFGLEWESGTQGYELWNFWLSAIDGTPADINEQFFFIRSNILDTLEEFTNNSPFWLLRSCIAYINKEIDTENPKENQFSFDKEMNVMECVTTKLPELYSYEFRSDAFSKLPEKSPFPKTDNLIGFNTFIMDEKIAVCKANPEQLKILDELYADNKKEAREAFKLKKEFDQIKL